MPICPKCDEYVPNKARICPRKICQTSANKLKKITAMTNGEKEDKLFKEIEEIINNVQYNFKFKTNWVTRKVGVEGKTYNDKILDVLSPFICLGKLQRVKFSAPKTQKQRNLLPEELQGKGHVHMKIRGEKCPYYKIGNDNDSCTYPRKYFKKVDEE